MTGSIEIAWPLRVENPHRQDELWSSTCFECFLGLETSPAYLEANLSPSGHWQGYEFSNYRQARLVSSGLAVHLTRSVPQEMIQFTIEVSDPRFVTADWKISPCCVLAAQTGEGYYMSAQHPSDKPDFHLSNTRNFTFPARSV